MVYGLVLWIVGFAWGMIVFMVPALKSIPSVPYISKFPAISGVLTIAYIVMLFYLARRYLETAETKMKEAVKLGMTIVLVNLILDIAVYVVLFASGDYFAYLSIWTSYVLFLIVPWLAAGRMYA